MHGIIEMIESHARSHPSPIEFEMAYQARAAIDCIRFAIKHVEQCCQPADPSGDARMHLLEALERLERVERRFRVRSLWHQPDAQVGVGTR
jgi:hypothetical protein